MAVFSKNLSQNNCGWTLLASLTVPLLNLRGLCWTWTRKSPRQELAVRDEDSLLKRNQISTPPRVTVALDQNRLSLISVLPGVTVQDQMQTSLTGSQKLKKEGKNLSYLHKNTSLSQSRRASSVSRSGKSPSQNSHDDVQLYRPWPSPSPGSRDLGPALRVYNSSGSGSEMADRCSSLPMMARRASKRFVEGYPKSTVDDALTGLQILSCQEVKHVEADIRMQQINQGVIESYLEMIANKLCSEPPLQNRYRPREEISYETSPRKKRKIEPKNDYVSDDDRVSVMASDEFEEAEEEAQPQQDYASRVFNPQPIDKDKWEPHEAIVNYVN